MNCTLLALAARLVLAAPAHGGGHVPPDLPPPPPPGPIPIPTGPAHPPYTGPPVGGPITPANPGPAGPTMPAPSGPITPGGMPMLPMTAIPESGPNLESWRYWWSFNR